MNHSGPWSWLATRQPKREPTAEEREYRKRVSGNKRKAVQKAREARQRAASAVIRKRNMEPIF